MKKNKDLFFTKNNFSEKNFNIGDFTYGKPSVIFNNDDVKLEIGKFCSIADGVTIFLGGNHRIDWISTYPFNDLPNFFPNSNNIIGHPSTKGDVIIGNDVWIGRGATILSGVKISDGAVIGAGAVITKNINAYEVWVGNPAICVKKRFDEHHIKNLLDLNWWNWDIEKIKENIVLLCSPEIDTIIKKQFENQ